MSHSTVSLGSLVEEVFDGPHATPKKGSHGPVFLGISSLVDGRIEIDQSARISEDDYAKWTRRVVPRPGDVVFSYETRIGEAALIPPGLRCCLGRRMGLLRPNRNKVDCRYLLYAWMGPDFQATLRARTVQGSTVDRILLTEIRDFPIRIVADLGQQRRIASILGALDDKIELHRRMNRTLEEMAQAVFKSWFIDFDGHDDLVESELGLIPRGWEVGAADDLVELLSGGTPKTSIPEYWGGSIAWYSVKDAPTEGDVWVIDTEKHVTESGIAHSAAQILPERTTIISARGTVGKLALTGVPMAMNQSCYGVRGVPPYPQLFTYFLLRQMVVGLRQRTHGSVFDTITRQTFQMVPTVIPPPELAGSYDAVVEPLLGRMLANLRESRTLAALRDTLLPKLISGEIRVPEAEEIMEEAL